MKKFNLAIVASHPIQYQAPLFRSLANDPRLDVTVYYCWDFGVSEPGFDKELGVKLKWDIPLLDGYKYKLLKNWSYKPGPTFFGQINFSIIDELKKNRYDAVLVHGYTTLTSWIIYVTRWYTKARVIMRGEADLGKKNSLVKRAFKKILLWSLFKTIPAFLYSYRLNKEFYKYFGVGDEKLFFFPCAVDNNFFSREHEKLCRKREELIKQFGLTPNILTFIFIGKLMKRKRTFDILKACELLKDKVKFNIIFIGDGEDRNSLEAYVKNNAIPNVYFFGFKNQSEIPAFYEVSDVLLLPSEFDPSPKQVNEALNFGIAFIVSDKVGTAPDLVADGKTGFIFPFGDIEALARHMEQFISNKTLLQNCKKNSFDLLKKWSYEADAEGLIQAIHKII